MSNSAWKQRLQLWKCCSPSFLADSLGPAWDACQSLPTQIITKIKSFVLFRLFFRLLGCFPAGNDLLEGLLTVFTALFPMRAKTSGSERLTAPPSPVGVPGDLQWLGYTLSLVSAWADFGVREYYCNLSKCRNYDRVFVLVGFYLW